MRTGQRQVARGFPAAAAVALVLPAIAVTWLGVLLLTSDRELDRQRVQERLASAATLVVGALEASISQSERRLAAVAASDGPTRADTAAALDLSPADGAVVLFSPETSWALPDLLYVADEPLLVDAAAHEFADAERREFAQNDLAGAAAAYRVMARSRDPVTRAGALARLGRVSRKLDQPDAAMAAYEELARLGTTPALGRPADLVASVERAAILKSASNDGALRAQAVSFDQQLVAAHWRLSRSQLAFYRSLAREWLSGDAGAADRDAAATARALVAEGAIVARRLATENTAAGRDTFDTEHGRGVVLWQRAGTHLAALVLSQAYVDRSWLGEVRQVATAQRARVSLVSDAPRVEAPSADVVAGAADAARAVAGPRARDAIEWLDAGVPAEAVRRSAADTGLPFTVRVASADPEGDISTFAGRRRLLAGMVAALAVLVAGSGYIAMRGAARERAAARLQSDFVAAVSHEFRTPVASVRQLTELLEEGRVPDEAKRREYYGRIRRQVVRLQHLVENLLDFGRMESSATEYRMAPLDPAALVRDVAAEFEAAVRGTPRHVEVVVPDALPAVVADREALGRALWNLLDNAAKYSPPETPIAVEAAADGGELVIRVSDRGPGIPADEQARIFDKFVRGAHARESGAKGTGLGLAMVRHIARAHRGDVTVDSAPGRGSTFILRLGGR